ncbi:MAG TPA: ribonuclease R [Acholeplasma sp.]|nr:ribonuclease R [Acholeplasma sp.]
MNNIYLKYYEENTRRIFEDELGELSSYKYLKYTKDHYYELNNNVFIGKVDKRAEFAFLLQDDDDLYIDKEQAKDIMDQDIILVEVKNRKTYVREILKRGLTHIIATVQKRKRGIKYYTDKPLGKSIVVGNEENIVDGSLVKLSIDTIKNNKIYASIESVIGHITDPDIDILKIVASHNWPDPNMDELEKAASNLNINIEEEKKKRLDLTDKLIITIDGADAKDLDDAISLEIIDNNYHLGVHIADVALYVKKGSIIDKAAYNKATSVYLADRVIPMLPRKLSNDLCSLNPHTEKLTMSALMVINEKGRVIDYEITNTVIESKHRLTYDEVNNLLNNNVSLGSMELDSLLYNMFELSNILSKSREKRGELNFSSEELKFVFDDNNNVIDVIPRKTDKGEAIVESFMLAANETVAFHMEENTFPSIYRIHEKPDSEKMEKAFDTLQRLNINVNKKAIHNVKTLQQILNESKDKDTEFIINMTLLRAMQKAKYDKNPIGHFGLAARYYTHFTSPIRRYPDLILHRIIKELVLAENNSLNNYRYYEKNLEEISKHTSRQERVAIDIEREVNQLKSCEYMQTKLGKHFNAQIIQILKTGFFVKIDKGIEGFVNIKNNYYNSFYEEATLSYVVSGQRYNIGDKLIVELDSVNMEDLEIDFIIIDKEVSDLENESNRKKQNS